MNMFDQVAKRIWAKSRFLDSQNVQLHRGSVQEEEVIVLDLPQLFPKGKRFSVDFKNANFVKTISVNSLCCPFPQTFVSSFFLTNLSVD